MISLDSVYAMLAKPATSKIKSKQQVNKVDNGAAIAADSHEAPQAQLPPHLERRTSTDDRRKNQQIAYHLDPNLERRKVSRRDNSAHKDQDSSLEQSSADMPESIHTRIDIDV